MIDFSNADQLNNRNDFGKELNSANTFDDADLFTTEERGLVDQLYLGSLDNFLDEPVINSVPNNDHFQNM